MRTKHMNSKRSAEQVVKDIRRATRKQYSAEEKIRIVLDGLRGEDSIAELSRFPDIVTISRNASFGLKDVTTNARELGQTLGVQLCLEGGVRKLSNRIRVNAYPAGSIQAVG